MDDARLEDLPERAEETSLPIADEVLLDSPAREYLARLAHEHPFSIRINAASTKLLAALDNQWPGDLAHEKQSAALRDRVENIVRPLIETVHPDTMLRLAINVSDAPEGMRPVTNRPLIYAAIDAAHGIIYRRAAAPNQLPPDVVTEDIPLGLTLICQPADSQEEGTNALRLVVDGNPFMARDKLLKQVAAWWGRHGPTYNLDPTRHEQARKEITQEEKEPSDRGAAMGLAAVAGIAALVAARRQEDSRRIVDQAAVVRVEQEKAFAARQQDEKLFAERQKGDEAAALRNAIDAAVAEIQYKSTAFIGMLEQQGVLESEARMLEGGIAGTTISLLRGAGSVAQVGQLKGIALRRFDESFRFETNVREEALVAKFNREEMTAEARSAIEVNIAGLRGQAAKFAEILRVPGVPQEASVPGAAIEEINATSSVAGAETATTIAEEYPRVGTEAAPVAETEEVQARQTENVAEEAARQIEIVTEQRRDVETVEVTGRQRDERYAEEGRLGEEAEKYRTEEPEIFQQEEIFPQPVEGVAIENVKEKIQKEIAKPSETASELGREESSRFPEIVEIEGLASGAATLSVPAEKIAAENTGAVEQGQQSFERREQTRMEASAQNRRGTQKKALAKTADTGRKVQPRMSEKIRHNARENGLHTVAAARTARPRKARPVQGAKEDVRRRMVTEQERVRAEMPMEIRRRLKTEAQSDVPLKPVQQEAPPAAIPGNEPEPE